MVEVFVMFNNIDFSLISLAPFDAITYVPLVRLSYW